MPEDDRYRLDPLPPKPKKAEIEEEEAPSKYATVTETAPEFIDAEIVKDPEEFEETDVEPESKDDKPKGSTELEKFNKMKANVALVREESGKLKFDYESKEGEKEARSHINKLRGMKGDVGRQKTALNTAARKHIETVNDTAKDLVKDLDEIIEVHQKPLDAKTEREKTRVENHLQNLEALALPTDIPHDVENLELLVNRFENITIDASWEEYREQGGLILGRTLSTLTDLLEGARAKITREEEKAAHDKKAAEDAKELAELKAANAKLKADAEAAETEKAATAKKAEEDKAAAAKQIEDDKIAAAKKSEDEKAEIQRKADAETAKLKQEAADAAQAVEDEKQRKIREEEIRKEAAAETKRIADAEKAKEAEAEQQRKDDEAHRVKLQSESAMAIEGLGVEFDIALRIVREIGAGKVPYISMKF